MPGFGRLSDAPSTFVLLGGRVVDPASGTDAVRDVAVVEGALVDAADAPDDARRLDARGLVVAPGFVDLHTHLRQPGDEAAETIESGTRAAARGGFTTVCAMPNTSPPLDQPERIETVARLGRSAAARVRVVGAVTRDRGGERLADLGALAEAGIVAASDDGASVPSAALTRAALAYLRMLDLPLIEHCEEPSLARGGSMRAGPAATLLGLGGWPASAELLVVERDLALAAETGARLHLTHLSTAAALEAVRRAKTRGVRVTCDVTPHHLAMTDTWVAGDRGFAWNSPASQVRVDPALAYDGSCRVNPPLPSRDDALALLAGVADGTVDAIATDHAPHRSERKLVEFEAAAPGMIGLETALSIGLEAVAAGCLSLMQLLRGLTSGPAAVIGERRSLELTGEPADLVAFDPDARWQVAPDALASRSRNTPLLGMELCGVVRLTVAAGRITYHDMLG